MALVADPHVTLMRGFAAGLGGNLLLERRRGTAGAARRRAAAAASWRHPRWTCLRACRQSVVHMKGWLAVPHEGRGDRIRGTHAYARRGREMS